MNIVVNFITKCSGNTCRDGIKVILLLLFLIEIEDLLLGVLVMKSSWAEGSPGGY